ncbi:HAMP domain-containing histidine kinase [Aggregicoccus sp. 17bor-14]|uniref:HAMP domain-containing sensor histidine kinase n=1 Tax=Myxococcaceae TaxID=31 RepID=UPI00129CABD5|nr:MULTISPECIES: HAMP domain-containing sensor histidine kinase [Myxococcaceae]MBF5042348.1 HAMP domain-containing histidine kinase [Simulacricoccus sp. 17bor-14]MRI88121.1 HAMP domain-containing histidine kinase [Aggregicoccus sp. 17bor-14]
MPPRSVFAGRLVFRIYAFGVAALVLLSLLGVVVARLADEGAPREGQVPRSAYLVNKIAEHWGDVPAMQAELDQVREAYRSSLSLYAADGTLQVSSGTPPLAPLSAEQLQQLRTQGPAVPGRNPVVLREDACGAPACELALPIYRGAQLVGYGVVQPYRPNVARPLLTALGVALLAFAIAALLAARSLARPLSRIADVARALGNGDLSARTGLKRRDELGEVARAVDEMAERLTGLLRAQTELLANVSHELRTPLSRIRVALELASETEGPLPEEFLGEVGRDLEELEQLVTEILATARLDLAHGRASGASPPLQTRPTKVSELVRSAADTLRTRHPQRPVEVEVASGLPDLDVDGVLLRRALGNLLSNAHKYSDAGQPIQLRARAEGNEVALSVEDHGIGLTPEDRAQLFTPFFRSDRSRTRGTGGVGLGLTLTKRIVEAHGGRVEVQSEAGHGSTFTLKLPVPPA